MNKQALEAFRTNIRTRLKSGETYTQIASEYPGDIYPQYRRKIVVDGITPRRKVRKALGIPTRQHSPVVRADPADKVRVRNLAKLYDCREADIIRGAVAVYEHDDLFALDPAELRRRLEQREPVNP